MSCFKAFIAVIASTFICCVSHGWRKRGGFHNPTCTCMIKTTFIYMFPFPLSSDFWQRQLTGEDLAGGYDAPPAEHLQSV